MLNISNTFSRYLVNMIVSKFNNHKYMNIILPTGLGKSFILLKYIESNKNIIFGVYTNRLLYDHIIETYNQFNNKNVKEIDNLVYVSSSNLLNVNINTLICFDFIPNLITFEQFINRPSNKNLNVILMTDKNIKQIRSILGKIHTEKFNMNRIIELSNLFDRKMKINKLIQKINNDN